MQKMLQPNLIQRTNFGFCITHAPTGYFASEGKSVITTRKTKTLCAGTAHCFSNRAIAGFIDNFPFELAGR